MDKKCCLNFTIVRENRTIRLFIIHEGFPAKNKNYYCEEEKDWRAHLAANVSAVKVCLSHSLPLFSFAFFFLSNLCEKHAQRIFLRGTVKLFQREVRPRFFLWQPHISPFFVCLPAVPDHLSPASTPLFSRLCIVSKEKKQKNKKTKNVRHARPYW